MPDQIPKPEPNKPSAGTAREVAPVADRVKAYDQGSPTEKVDDRTHPTARGPIPFRYRDQILLGSACAIALAFMAVYCVRTSHWGADPIELERQPQHELDYKIDLNSATWVEWSQLPGIGPVLAHRIVEEREQNGPFRDIDDLNRVRGIGSKKIDAIRPFIRTDSRDDPQGTVSDVPRQVGSAKSP